MDQRRVLTPEVLASLVGQEVALSDWVEVSQEQVNLFAQATGDFQWIHVDVERASKGPFGGTIAHGFLTLSLIPKLVFSALDFGSGNATLNYGVNRVRFPAPLPVGRRIRARCQLDAVQTLPHGGTQSTWAVSVEAEGIAKPVCVAECLLVQL